MGVSAKSNKHKRRKSGGSQHSGDEQKNKRKQQKTQPDNSHQIESDDALETFRRNLPTFPFRNELIQHITKSNKVLLISAETGSGKSTQIPAYILNSNAHNPFRIAVTQPRRVAAMTLARRVRAENNDDARVAYKVRFDDTTTHETRLTYITDGMLLREAMVDPLLRKYDVVFLDEVHIRSVQTDVLLGVLVRARAQRTNLRVVVMSATLPTRVLETFFGADSFHAVAIPGRIFPVELLYTPEPVEDYLEAALSTILQIHEHEPSGDILVFLPGQEEIQDMAALLKQQLEEQQHNWTDKNNNNDRAESFAQYRNTSHSTIVNNNVMISLLYASLPAEAQLAAFADKPPGVTRKIILATTIAETSVTLPDITYVVDTGKHKCRRVNEATTTGMECLIVESISQEQAAQRSGRAGRVQAGLCFRLYPEEVFERLPQTSLPEILRVNLAHVLLQLKGMGIQDPTTFEFVTKPSNESWKRATKLLYAVKALDDKLSLTEYGKQLAKLPLDPTFGHLLLQSVKYGCVSEMLTAVSVLSAENVFYRPSDQGSLAKAAASHRRFASYEGDLPTFLNVYQAWQTEAQYSHHNKNKQKNHGAKVSHGEWCQRNYVSGRAMVRAYHVRQQLRALCEKPLAQNGLGMDVTISCGKEREGFLRCAAAGLFLQAASRTKGGAHVDNSKGRSGLLVQSNARGRYTTKIGNETVSIHPSSSMFGRNPAPACVVYTELVQTKQTYIRGVTQIREEWLHEVAPEFYPK
jgi:ATP-dependent RNA helicase DHX8/PRP22